MRTFFRRSRLRRWSPLAAIGAASALVMLSATSAQALTLTFGYDASGSTHITSTDSTIALGPTQLITTVDMNTGAFTGSMELPGSRSAFKVAGFIPVTADVSFEPVTPVSGTLTPHPEGGGHVVQASTSYDIRLSNIDIAGFPTFTGSHCRTIEPVAIDLATPADERFQLFSGGNVAGTYDIGTFENCGLNTWLINLLVPGEGNTLSFALSNGQVIPQ
jgi:hypothetical protein